MDGFWVSWISRGVSLPAPSLPLSTRAAHPDPASFARVGFRSAALAITQPARLPRARLQQTDSTMRASARALEATVADECHKKITNFLVSNYNAILLPSFETQQMVIRNQRKIRSKTARAMITWSHYRFKQRLLFKRKGSTSLLRYYGIDFLTYSLEFPSCRVVICDEAYTSKTCGQCGHLHLRLGGAKTFKCPSCSLVVDRDVNAARNILLKNASLFGFRVE